GLAFPSRSYAREGCEVPAFNKEHWGLSNFRASPDKQSTVSRHEKGAQAGKEENTGRALAKQV
ncbi:MAG TPA: hypothetical protein VFS41_02145, partial [Edaphobacter sp.]|nr:hypothetical protein [Edaphobacter sp.]